MSFFGKAMIGSALTFAAIPVAYLIRLTYARAFSVESFGLFYSIIALLTLLSVLAKFGTGPAIAHLMPKHHRWSEKRELATAVGLVMIGGSLVIGIALFVLAPWLEVAYFKTEGSAFVLRIMTGYFLAFQALQLIRNVFYGLGTVWAYAGSQFYRLALVLAGSIGVAVLTDLSIVTAAIVWAITHATLYVIYTIVLRIRFPRMGPSVPSKRTFAELFSYALPSILVAGASVLIWQVDTVMLTALRTIEDVAAYNVAYPTAQLVMTVFTPLIMVILPEVSALYHDKRIKEAQHLTERIVRIMTAVSVLAALLLTTLSKPVLELLFGSTHASAWPALSILAFGLAANGLANINLQTLGAIGKVGRRATIMNVTVITNIVLNIALIPFLGFIGAAIATTTTYAFLLGFSVIELRTNGFRTLTFDQTWKLGVPTVLAGGFVIGLTLLLPPGIWMLVIALACGTLIYAASSIATRGIVISDLVMLWNEGLRAIPNLGERTR